MIADWLTTVRKAVGLRRPTRQRSDREIVDALFSNLSPRAPGYGADVHSSDARDWPSAYGLLTSASIRAGMSEGALLSARWLVSAAGCASTHAPCWGIPYSRKIWEDAEPVLPGTAFAIPTCHAIQALDEAAAVVDDKADASRFRLSAARAAEYFAENCCDEYGDELVVWYSPLRQHSFHVVNAIAMMAGQMQRASRFSAKADLLTDCADRATRYVLRRMEDGPGGPGWNYFGDRIPSGKANKKNDLLHEAFVCHGLIEYKANGGRFGQEIDHDAVLASLGRFFRGGTFFEFPGDEAIKSRVVTPARAMGLGHGLYVASRIQGETGISNGLSAEMSRAICSLYVEESDLYHRPGGTMISTYVRDVAHVMLGLAEHHCSREVVASSGRKPDQTA